MHLGRKNKLQVPTEGPTAWGRQNVPVGGCTGTVCAGEPEQTSVAPAWGQVTITVKAPSNTFRRLEKNTTLEVYLES